MHTMSDMHLHLRRLRDQVTAMQNDIDEKRVVIRDLEEQLGGCDSM